MKWLFDYTTEHAKDIYRYILKRIIPVKQLNQSTVCKDDIWKQIHEVSECNKLAMLTSLTVNEQECDFQWVFNGLVKGEGSPARQLTKFACIADDVKKPQLHNSGSKSLPRATWQLREEAWAFHSDFGHHG